MALRSSPKWWKVQPFHSGVSMTGDCQRVDVSAAELGECAHFLHIRLLRCRRSSSS